MAGPVKPEDEGKYSLVRGKGSDMWTEKDIFYSGQLQLKHFISYLRGGKSSCKCNLDKLCLSRVFKQDIECRYEVCIQDLHEDVLLMSVIQTKNFLH